MQKRLGILTGGVLAISLLAGCQDQQLQTAPEFRPGGGTAGALLGEVGPGDFAGTATAIQSHLLSPLLAVGDLPRIDVTDAEARRLAMGQTIENRWSRAELELAAVNERNEFIAIAVPISEREIRASKSFA